MKNLQRSKLRRKAIYNLKSKFEQQALFRQISKRLINYHACLETLGGSGADISSIKNPAGRESFKVGNRYGRGIASLESLTLTEPSGNKVNLEVVISRFNKRKNQTFGKLKKIYPINLIGSATNLQGCHWESNTNVTNATQQLCDSIEGAAWTSGRCKPAYTMAVDNEYSHHIENPMDNAFLNDLQEKNLEGFVTIGE